MKGKEETEGIGGGGSGPDEGEKEKKRTEWEITGMTAGIMWVERRMWGSCKMRREGFIWEVVVTEW
jgi:hypothetical protein